MDEQQQQRLNQAAEQFANTIRDSSRALAERGISAQEMKDFFNRVIENLHTQAVNIRQPGQQLLVSSSASLRPGGR